MISHMLWPAQSPMALIFHLHLHLCYLYLHLCHGLSQPAVTLHFVLPIFFSFLTCLT